MKPDDFEERIRQQPLRELPQEWRREILGAAQAAMAPRPVPLSWRERLSALLWPCPEVWAGLAAIWLGILVVNVASTERTERMAKKTAPTSAQVMMALREQEQILTELIEPHETSPAIPPRIIESRPRPRSQRQQEFMMV